jgi:hypothetical protein
VDGGKAVNSVLAQRYAVEPRLGSPVHRQAERAAVQLAAHHDAAFGEAELFTHLLEQVPPGLNDGGRDELCTDVPLGH